MRGCIDAALSMVLADFSIVVDCLTDAISLLLVVLTAVVSEHAKKYLLLRRSF